MSTLDFQPLLRPLLDSAAEYRHEWEEMESSLEGVLEDMELLQLQLDEKNLQLDDAHQQLQDVQEENRQLLRRVEQQDGRLEEALTELRRLAEDQQQLQQTILLAIESSLTVSEDVRESALMCTTASQSVPAEVAAELKLLRELLEAQAARSVEVSHAKQRTGHSGANLAPVVPSSPSAEAEAAAAPPAGVVNSVMAQFAKLQKDVAQRKKRR